MEFENHHDGNEDVAKLNVIAETCFVARDLKDNEQSRERWVGERSKPGGAWNEK